MPSDGGHQKLWIGMEDIRSPGLLWTPSEALDCHGHQKPACGFFFFFLCGTNKSTCKQPLSSRMRCFQVRSLILFHTGSSSSSSSSVYGGSSMFRRSSNSSTVVHGGFNSMFRSSSSRWRRWLSGSILAAADSGKCWTIIQWWWNWTLQHEIMVATLLHLHLTHFEVWQKGQFRDR
jgi:hypothetical protein